MSEALSNVNNPDGHHKISVSELGTLQRCTKKHDYGYRQGLKGKDTPVYFTRGSYLHVVMELWLQGLADDSEGPPLSQIFDKALWLMRDREKGAVPEHDRTEINQTVASYVEAMGLPPFEVLGVEQEFYIDVGWRIPSYKNLELPSDRPVLLHGVIDGIIRDNDGDLWLVEHKTASKAWDQGQFNFNMQGALYLDAWQAFTGERPVGILYNFFYPRGKYETKQIFISAEDSAYVREEAQRVINLRESELIVRSPVWGCRDCSFRDICYAELIGHDTTLTREQRFIVDEEKRERFHVSS